jgi:hypothetical protein
MKLVVHWIDDLIDVYCLKSAVYNPILFCFAVMACRIIYTSVYSTLKYRTLCNMFPLESSYLLEVYREFCFSEKRLPQPYDDQRLRYEV